MKKIVIIFIILLLASSVWAVINPEEIITFEVPGLTGPIEQFKFNDVDGDGIPEVLASDGEKIVLYSYSKDSVLFISNINVGIYPDKIRYQLELADINRDSIPDIIFGSFFIYDEYSYKVAIISFDGSSNFQNSDTVIHTPGLGAMWYSRTNGVTALQAIDINSDGYNELMYSYESLVYSFFSEKTNGYNYFFYSFPDSLLREKQYNTSNLQYLSSNSTGFNYITTRYNVSVYDWPGVNGYSVGVYPILFKDNGDITNLNILTDNKSNSTGVSASTDISNIECIGNINSNSTGINFIISNWRSTSNEEYDQSGDSVIFTHSSDSKQSLYEMIDYNLAEEIWYKEGTTLTNFLYHPSFPGYFFAFEDDYLKQFNGSDGSINQSFDTQIEGVKEWVYPFNPDEPILSVIDNNKISLYKFDISTGVDDKEPGILPASFTLSQNYPNPFNPATQIEYAIPSKGKVEISVYNILGQRIDMLVDEIKEAGTHTATWNGKDSPSGIYLIKVSYDSQIKTIKSVLLK